MRPCRPRNKVPVLANLPTILVNRLLGALPAGQWRYLRADESIPYGRVMFVMDQCRKGGIQQVGLVVKPAPAQGQGG